MARVTHISDPRDDREDPPLPVSCLQISCIFNLPPRLPFRELAESQVSDPT